MVKGPSTHHGLAIVVACPGALDDFLHGVIIDYEKVVHAFKDQLNFAVLPLLRAKASDIDNAMEKISEAAKNLPKNYKAIVFVFSGHGYEKYVRVQDENLKIFRDIITPLSKTFEARMPKLFFIDTCRGGKEDRGVAKRSSTATSRRREDSNELYTTAPFVPTFGNYLIGYSTKLTYTSLAPSTGSYWLQCLIEELLNVHNSDMTITDILTSVNARVVAKMANDEKYSVNRHIQQPVFVSTLCQHLYFRQQGMA